MNLLKLTSFLSGTFLMILEMTSSRLFAPFFGTSVIVWTSLIGSILLFLSIGGYFGGKLADKKLSYKLLSSFFIIIGCSVCFIAIANKAINFYILYFFENLYISTLISSVILLGIPAFLFGVISPYLTRLAMEQTDKKDTGNLLGTFYALSTSGSIAGTFLGGFILIYWFGSVQILFGIAICLFVLAGFYQRRNFLFFFLLIVFIGGIDMDEKFIKIETPYNVVTILDGEYEGKKTRMLLTSFDGIQSAVCPDNLNDPVLDYATYFITGLEWKKNFSDVLTIGGGGYSVPRIILNSYPAVQQTVVEIDSGITKIAEDFFFLKKNDKLKNINEDARIFLNSNKNKYDIIMMDVFNNANVPFHLVTIENLNNLKKSLKSDGLLMINTISSFSNTKKSGFFFEVFYSMLLKNFKHVLAVFTSIEEIDKNIERNVIFFVFKNENEKKDFLLFLKKKRGDFRVVEEKLVKEEFSDNFAPVL